MDIKRIWMIGGFIFLSTLLWAENDTDTSTVVKIEQEDVSARALMTKANTHYEAGEYSSAEKIYRKILDEGLYSDALYFNLGNTYFKLKDVGRAILFYERALKLNPKDDDILFNLQFARQMTIDKIEVQDDLWFKRFVRGFLYIFSINGWAWLCLIMAALAVVIWAMFLSNRIPFLLGVWGLVISLSISLLALMSSFGRNAMDTQRCAVLLVEASPVKSAPTEKGEDIFIIHQGIKMEILEQYQDWYKIKLSNGNVGWLPVDTFEEI